MPIGSFSITNKNGAPLTTGFYPGQVIEGLVSLTVTDEHMKCKGIRLEISGKGRVAWSETRMLKGKEQTERLREDETYVDHVRYLKGSGDSEQDEVTLPVGQLQVVDGDGPTGFDTPVQRPDLNSENGRSIQQQLPFSYALPHNIPPCFEGPGTGYIRYTMQAIIDFAMEVDPTTEIALTVLARPISLAGTESPVSERDEKTLGYFCCVTGPISCSVRLAKTGFVEGETVMANVGIDNQSNRVMEESTCRLLQKITYSTGSRKKVNEVIIDTIKRPKVQAGSEESWMGGMTIPFGITPSELPGCNIIGVEYEIAVSISQLVVNPVGLEAAVPVRISAGAEGAPVPDVVMPPPAAAKLQDQPPALPNAVADEEPDT